MSRSLRLRKLILMACAAIELWAGATPAYAQEPSSVFDSNCALCHQIGGVGLKGQFPRLAGRAREIAATTAGVRYLEEVVLFGMAGRINVDGAAIIGVMPAFAALSDEDLASALTYVIQLEGSRRGSSRALSVTAANIRETRGIGPSSPSQVLADRGTVPGISAKPTVR